MQKTYVLHVLGGTEDTVVRLIERLVPAQLVGSCYVLRRQVKKRVDGVWRTVLELLTPGYVYIETDDPARLTQALRSVPRLTRMLEINGTFVSLEQDELAWLQQLVDGDSHTVAMSEGVFEGDQIVIISGPLQGCEGLICKIDRHKRVAWLDMHLFGRMKTVKVGLEVVKKERAHNTGESGK